MSTTSFSPSASDFYTTLMKVVDEIEPSQRVHVLIPRSISHQGDRPNWEELDGIQLEFTHSLLKPNVFMVLRFDHTNEAGDVVVDVCHFTS